MPGTSQTWCRFRGDTLQTVSREVGWLDAKSRAGCTGCFRRRQRCAALPMEFFSSHAAPLLIEAATLKHLINPAWVRKQNTNPIYFLKTKTVFIDFLALKPWDPYSLNNFSLAVKKSLGTSVLQKHYKTLYDITVGWTVYRWCFYRKFISWRLCGGP